MKMDVILSPSFVDNDNLRDFTKTKINSMSDMRRAPGTLRDELLVNNVFHNRHCSTHSDSEAGPSIHGEQPSRHASTPSEPNLAHGSYRII